jgi:hypothetical protein
MATDKQASLTLTPFHFIIADVNIYGSCVMKGTLDAIEAVTKKTIRLR